MRRRRRDLGALPVRGIMADPARLIERREFYFDLLEMMAGWGLNTLWWHFADDEGFMLKLRSHPEIATAHAFSKAEMKRLLAKAADCGIDVVPEVESLGHARYITRLPQYAELADGGEHGFNAICPSHRRTLPILKDIIEEVAELFPSRYFHAGLDEVNLGDCPRCRRRSRGKPRWRVYAEHVKAVHRIVRACGKQMIIWADHVEKDPAMLKVLPKDIIMAHWHYTKIRPDAFSRSLAAGFRVIGCPAMCHSGDVIMPNAANFQNMDAMVERVSRLRPRRAVLGVVNTWWTLWRGLRDAYLPAVAYTAAMLRAVAPVDKAAFFKRLTRELFGLGEAAAARAMRELHETMLSREEIASALFDSPADMHGALALAEQPGFVDRGRRIEQAAAALRKSAAKVRSRRDEFNALMLAGELAGLCCRRIGQLASAMGEYRRIESAHDWGVRAEHLAPRLDELASIFRQMRDEVRAALQAAVAEWDRTRYKDDVKKGLNDSWPVADSLLRGLDRCGRFAAELERSFRRAAADYRRGGQLPMSV